MLDSIKNYLFKNISTRQIFAKNTAWISVGEIVSRILKMIFVILGARILGSEGWGIFAYAISLCSILMVFSDMGLSILVTREASHGQNWSYLSTATSIKTVISILNFFLVIILAPLMSRVPGAISIIPIAALILLLDSLREYTLSINRATQKMEGDAFVKISTNALVLISGLMYLYVNPSPLFFAFAYLTGGIVGTIYSIKLIRSILGKLRFTFSKAITFEIWKSAWPIAIIALSGSILFSIDTVMIGWWRNVSEIGQYSAIQRLTYFLYIIPGILTLSSFPLFSKFAKSKLNKTAVLTEKMLSLTLLAGIPIVLGGIVLSHKLILAFFGQEFIAASYAFIILLTTVLFVFPNSILSQTIVSHDMQRKMVMPIIFSLLINIVINLALIPTTGIAGAATATVLAQFVIFWNNFRIVKTNWNLNLFPAIKKIVVASIVMLIFVVLANFSGLNFILNILAAICIYFSVLILIKEPVIEEIVQEIKISDICKT